MFPDKTGFWNGAGSAGPERGERSGADMNGKKIPGKYACMVKVGEKGQIVIPKEVREMFGIRPGDTLMLLADAKRGVAIPPKEKFEKLARTIFVEGFFGEEGQGEDGGAQA